MTEKELRQKYASVMLGWKGRKESDGSHKAIIDLYNSQKKLPRGYKVKYTDQWCATTVSAAAIKAGLTAIIPVECSCPQMIELAKAMKIWQEKDNYTPKLGDIVLYDWQDNGIGDNTGVPDHIGVVTEVNSKSFTVTEGNKNDCVCDRVMAINGRYIRGFICPNFSSLATKEEPKKNTTAATITTAAKQKVEAAKKFNKSLAGTYEVTASDYLNLRYGAGTSKGIITKLKSGKKVKNYGYYTEVNGVKWLYVMVSINGVTHTGFCSSQFLKK